MSYSLVVELDPTDAPPGQYNVTVHARIGTNAIPLVTYTVPPCFSIPDLKKMLKQPQAKFYVGETLLPNKGNLRREILAIN